MLLSANPVVWSRCLFVLHTFVPRPLWHPENKYLAKLHHKSSSPSESCEAIRHLIEGVHFLLYPFFVCQKRFVKNALISTHKQMVWGGISVSLIMVWSVLTTLLGTCAQHRLINTYWHQERLSMNSPLPKSFINLESTGYHYFC